MLSHNPQSKKGKRETTNCRISRLSNSHYYFLSEVLILEEDWKMGRWEDEEDGKKIGSSEVRKLGR